MMEAYRVLRPFNWSGWWYSAPAPCRCNCKVVVACTERPGTSCSCDASTTCRCVCKVVPEQYAGDIWIVYESHPRKAMMLAQGKATYDPTLLSPEELLKDEKYSRLLVPYISPEEREFAVLGS